MGGRITIVECKLRANPQFRREVVGQVPAYAGAIWQMGADDFCSAGRRAPVATAKSGDQASVRAALGGPGGAAGIILRTTLPAGSSARRWSERELAAVADPSATIPQGNGRFALRMLFVRGQNVRSPNILAVSFRGDTFAAFPDQYASSGQNVITTVTPSTRSATSSAWSTST